MAKVVIAAVEKRFPEGGFRQLYSDVQWLNSSWWELELGQTYQENQQAVGMSGTQQLYDMVSTLADPFNDEFYLQVPVHSDGNKWEEYRVAPKVSPECTQERNVNEEDGMAKMQCPLHCGMSVCACGHAFASGTHWCA
jgi:hypothetical protein